MAVGSLRCLTASTPEEVIPHLTAWERLESRALEDNVYLSGAFMTAVLRHLPARRPRVLVFVLEGGPQGEELIGVAAFEVLPPESRRPLRTLATSTDRHGFYTSPLLDRERGAAALGALWDWIERPEHPWDLVLLRQVKAQSPFSALLAAELLRRGRAFVVTERVRRPTLSGGRSFDEYLSCLGPSRRRAYRRSWRHLTERGRVDVVLHRDDSSADLAGRFLHLEQLGWKGEAGSALACVPGGEAFFREATSGLARSRRLFFVELLLEGRPIALSANFVAGRSLFAFKVGYDPDFKDLSPGILSEVQCVRHFLETPSLDFGDSGADDTAFVTPYWPGSVDLDAMYVATPRLISRAFVRAFPALSRLKARLRRRGEGDFRPGDRGRSGGTSAR